MVTFLGNGTSFYILLIGSYCCVIKPCCFWQPPVTFRDGPPGSLFLSKHPMCVCVFVPFDQLLRNLAWRDLGRFLMGLPVHQRQGQCFSTLNWRAPWKNRISSTTMKLRKSLVKPVTRQNISSCLVLPPEIVMHDAFNVILWTSADICVVVHDLGWKNRTTRYNCRFSAASLALRVIFVWRKHPPIYASCMTISGGRFEQHALIGFGELAAVD